MIIEIDAVAGKTDGIIPSEDDYAELEEELVLTIDNLLGDMGYRAPFTDLKIKVIASPGD
jgi:hypothetical protein